MEVWSSPEFDEHEKVIFVADRETGLRAIIAIHDTTMGPAGGGCRMWPYESTQAALDDVLRLSRAMTYKLAFIGARYGGGKAVIIGDPRKDKNEALLRAMARAVDKLAGAMTISEDVGLTVDDLVTFSKETQYVVGLPGQSGDTSPPTAYGIFCGLKSCLRHGLEKESFEGVHFAIQGLGNVGFRRAEHLARAGARLTVADTVSERVARAEAELGAESVDADAIYDVAADVFSPCALGGAINDGTVPRLRAKVVAGAANNQLHRDRHAETLRERGILYAPDYVINGGGAINASQGKFAYDEARIRREIEAIEGKLDTIFARAATEGRSPLAVANRMAEEILGRA
jgi:leucine dehydrogenase